MPPISSPTSDQQQTSESLLRRHGLRVTAQRVAVLEAIQPGQHLDADHVAYSVRQAIGPTATQTIYDSLTALTDAGLLRRIEPAGSAMLYDRRTGDNHHHAICRRCHRIDDVDCVIGAPPCLEPPDNGYLIDEAEVVFWGLCPDCQKKTS